MWENSINRKVLLSCSDRKPTKPALQPQPGLSFPGGDVKGHVAGNDNDPVTVGRTPSHRASRGTLHPRIHHKITPQAVGRPGIQRLSPKGQREVTRVRARGGWGTNLSPSCGPTASPRESWLHPRAHRTAQNLQSRSIALWDAELLGSHCKPHPL